MRTVLLTLLVAALSAVLAAAPATAQQDDQERLREIERMREEKARTAETLRRRTETADAAMRRLQASLVALAEELQAAEGLVTASEEALAGLDAEARRLTGALLGRRRAIGDVLGALQMLERRRPPALLVSPDDANRAAVAAIALSSVTPELTGEASRLSADLDRIGRVRARAAREREELGEAEAALAERRRLLEDTLAERERRQAEDVTRLRRVEREDEALAREAENLRALLEGIDRRDRGRADVPEAEAEALAARALPSAVPLYDELPARFAEARARLPLPAAGRIARRYGEEIEGGGRSQDLAIATRPGAVVTAPFGGTVKWAKPYGALGNIVILDVGGGYALVLMGLGEFDVRRDDVVRPGTPLGTMPQGGGLLRLHLRAGGDVLDPEPWLRPEALAAR